MQSRVGEYQVIEAFSEKKIRQLSNKEEKITDVLKYAMRLMGVKTLPTSEEKQTIVDFITYQYSDMTIGEIKNAFTLAVSGELDYTMSIPVFSSLVISNVFNSYKRFRAKMMSRKSPEYEQRTASSEEKKSIEAEFIAECIIKTYEKYLRLGKKEGDDFITHACPIYDLLYEKAIISPTDAEKKKMMNRSAKQLKENKGRNQQLFKKLLDGYDKDKQGNSIAEVRMKQLFIEKWYKDNAEKLVGVQELEVQLRF